MGRRQSWGMDTTTAAPTRTVERASAGSTAPAAIDLSSLTKSFGQVHAVRGVDLTIAQGEVVALLGPNGAGKTTTVDMVLGLADPDAGRVEVFGLAPADAVSRGLVSAVMQSGGLLKDLTVRETVQYTASLFASARPVADVLETAGLTEIAGRRVGKCSGGEQQRLRFAMALVVPRGCRDMKLECSPAGPASDPQPSKPGGKAGKTAKAKAKAAAIANATVVHLHLQVHMSPKALGYQDEDGDIAVGGKTSK